MRCSSNRGVYRVSRSDLNAFAQGKLRSVTSEIFSIKDGLISNEVNGGAQPSGLKTADGKLWFPTMACELTVDGETHKLVSDEKGKIETDIPTKDEKAALLIKDPMGGKCGPKDPGETLRGPWMLI